MTRSIILTVDTEGSPGQILEALTTREGLASFWTPQVGGDPGAGGQVSFGFEAAPVDLEVAVRSVDAAAGVVEWDCQGPWPYWTGTRIRWELIDGDQRRVLFSHDGWDKGQPDEDFGAIGYTWALVLGSLKAYVESGMATPALR